ncbi:MAG: hypothetical protein RLZZ298_650 [Pseudomonadota bacterium]|jgi:hypothetical protein
MRFLAPFLFALIGGCATIVVSLQLDERFGPADPGRFDRPALASGSAPDYWREVRPVLDQRCVSCHACYDAPCQLNLASYAGITRGASAQTVYSGTRLLADQPTRLNFDALTNRDWRAKGFFPVLNERTQVPEANREGGVMYRSLAMKRAASWPLSGPVDNRDIDFAIDREQTCVRAAAMDDYAQRHPQRGMPFALPPLADAEYNILTRWLEAGAPYQPPPSPSSSIAMQVAAWEALLNGDDKRSQLVARYIYEHWYIGQFHFPEQPERNFDLVRSRTPSGQPIDVIATRRPFDAPGVDRVYYRLRPIEATQVAKTYMPLELSPARLTRIRGWFFDTAYPVEKLPGYEPEIASNPFVTFRALPVNARYRFMLDEAQFTMMGFMKGPVCRGQVALNVINDHFWVVFLEPGERENKETERLLNATAPTLNLPAEHQSTVGLLAWRDYAEKEKKYLEAKGKLQSRLMSSDYQYGVNKLWDGDGSNPNAALTVLRHFDSASVVRGLVGEQPQTALVLGYPLFERMHYLLVAGFDVYGNVGHQLATRLYMDFLRMEGELTFVSLLPAKDRKGVVERWYRGGGERHLKHFSVLAPYFKFEPGQRYRSNDHLGELYHALKQQMAAVRDPLLDWQGSGLSDAEVIQMRRLAKLKGQPVARLPEMSLLLLKRAGQEPSVVSLVSNSAHSNVAEMFGEERRRLPEEDTLLAINGVAGAYPNAIFAVDVENLPKFVDAVSRLASMDDLVKLTEGFGIRRTNPDFWAISDTIHAIWRKMAPREAAVLDYSRLDNL